MDFQYLRGTLKFEMLYKKGNASSGCTMRYADADFAVDINKRRSMTRYDLLCMAM